MIDLHRHDEYSTFDGFGKASDLAELAEELGYKSLCTANHGNTNGLIKTYNAAKAHGLKAILGVEGYFLPKWKEKERGYHLCLFAKNLKGYHNLNAIQYAGDAQKYFNPIWDFEMLEKYSEGIICTSACVASYLAQAIIKGDKIKAVKFIKKMKEIYKDDFYIEVQPYKISEEGVQEKVNVESIRLAKALDVKCILTSDSHRGRKEDLASYMKMHEIANHNSIDIEGTYSERYMPELHELPTRFFKMHRKDFVSVRKLALEMCEALEEIEDKCEANYLDSLPFTLPKFTDEKKKSYDILVDKVKEGLQKRGIKENKYIRRCKEELSVIKHHGFEDYFLIVADYTNWAKDNGIAVGPGRGSVCNCLVAYALYITEVDSLYFGLDFGRFMRMDKKAHPDIDLDFQTSRRFEVIDYLTKKYKGKAARISSYGLYKADNLINDLAKVSGLQHDNSIDAVEASENKTVVQAIKKLIKKYVNDDGENLKGLLEDADAKVYNKKYDDIILHFTKLYRKVRFIGAHAAGVAITGGDLLDYAALKVDKEGTEYINYDLEDAEQASLFKFDILGLKTMESINDLRTITKKTVNYLDVVQDETLFDNFCNRNCAGVFQFESNTAQGILESVECSNFNDVVATNAMNRPGPLQMKQPLLYAENKQNIDEAKKSKYWEFTRESYGTIIYQEQIQQICVKLGGMAWSEADTVMKMIKGNALSHTLNDELMIGYKKKFVKGAIKKGLKQDEAALVFDKMLTYSFNKGHSVGYSLLSIEEMFYKVYYPTEFWYVKMKYSSDEQKLVRYKADAVKNNVVIFLPHVNYSANYSIRKIDNESVIQEGLSAIKGIGDKAAEAIQQEKLKYGVFTSYDNFYDRCKSRAVTSRVISLLVENGALEFDKKKYIKRCVKYNSALLMK